ncbi:MAG TPA: oligosaccharide flippase family protein [Nitrososphaerales archaeon]|nr:oligosaccharide flippase family protein [Nitrososphaerales archaeon]
MGETPPEETDQRVRNIARGVSSLSAQYIVTSLLAFVLLAFLARILGVSNYGIYSAVLLVVGIALAFSNFGLQLASTRYVALLRTSDEQESWAAARSTLLLTLGFTIVVTLAYAALTPYLSLFFTKSTQWTNLFLLGGMWLFGSSLAVTLLGVIQGLKKYALMAKMLLGSRVIMVAFTILALLEFNSIMVPLVGWALYYFLIILWSFKVVGKGILSKKKNYPYSTILKYSFPLAIAGVIQVFASNSDALAVGGYLPSSSLGIYNAVLQLTAVVGIVLVTPLVTAFFPEASSTKESEISNAFRLALRFIMLSVLPASFVMAGFSSQLLTLFSSSGSYLNGVVPMDLIAFFYLFVAIQGIATYLLQAIGHTTQVMISGIAGAAVVIFASISLVPEFGIMGAAISRISASIVGLGVALYFSRRHIGRLDNIGFYLKCVVCSILPFLALYLLGALISTRTLTLIPYVIVAGLVFLLCIKILKVLTEEDKRYISHLLPPFAQRFLKYV